MSHKSTLAEAPAAEELRQTGPLQQRSLSLPLGRIVLNPQNFMSGDTEVEQNCDPTFPLGLGYYAFDKAIILQRFLSLWALAPDPQMPARPSTLTFPVVAGDFVSSDDAHAKTDGAALSVSISGQNEAHIGAVRARVRLDDQAPILRVAVRSVTGQWALHLDREGADPVMLLPGAATLGLLHIDLRTHMPDGLEGEFALILSVIGPGARVTIDELRFVPALNDGAVGALDFDADWSPGGLGLSGRYRSTRVRGLDTFVDDDSALREFVFDEPLSPETPMLVVGRHVVAPAHDATSGTVTMASREMSAVVAIAGGGPIRYYADESELATGYEGTPVPLSPVGIWAIPLAPGQTRYRIGVGVTPNDATRAAELALDAIRADAFERREHWLGHWDELIGRMPHPSSFELRAVDAQGVEPETVREAYYRAYIALLANVLPPQPETGYAFPTIATGKASMWNHGAPGASSAAAWETFLAIQFLAYADGDLAWSCFNGLMSLVDDEGSLAGESLPSRKAQTAWVLYSITCDESALGIGYPALRRLLEWQAKRPRWVYGTYDNPGEQDAEFLSSLIIDLGFGSQIAWVLGRDEDATRFDQLQGALRRDYESHCFLGPQREAVQHWFPGNDASIRGGPQGHALQVAMGLAVPDLADWQVNALLARFDAQFDASEQLAGFDIVKHPNVSYTVAGLLEHDRAAQAQAVLNAMLRDVIRSGSFAEVYDRGADHPRPWGVRPSIFGMTQVIDAVWLNNGLRMDLGTPRAITLPGLSGGVSNIPLAGARLALAVREGYATLADESAATGRGAVEFPVTGGGIAFPPAAFGERRAAHLGIRGSTARPLTHRAEQV